MRALWQDLRCGARIFVASLTVAALAAGFSLTGAQNAPASQAQTAAEISAALQRALGEEVAATPCPSRKPHPALKYLRLEGTPYVIFEIIAALKVSNSRSVQP